RGVKWSENPFASAMASVTIQQEVVTNSAHQRCLALKPYSEVAVSFATALVEGDFARANALLAPELRRRLTPEALPRKLYAMFRGSCSGEPQSVHFDEEFQMESWPSKRPGDVGWAYVGIHGDGFVEAVTVVVAEIEGELLVREIEWRRP